jgi:hypothetical protein
MPPMVVPVTMAPCRPALLSDPRRKATCICRCCGTRWATSIMFVAGTHTYGAKLNDAEFADVAAN